jgi:hypothetical protein
MEPEEIDKLFRDRLAGLPATPAADAWMRLQQKMDPPKKEKTMWIYYAAASVVILLVASILYFKHENDPTGPAVATAPGVTQPAPILPAESPEPAEAPNPNDQPLNQEPASQLAQVPVAAPAKATKPQLAAKPRKGHPAARNKAVISVPAPALAASSQPVPTETRKAVTAPVSGPTAVKPGALASAAPALEVVEVVVTRGPESSADGELTIRENLSRKGNLLKNIYQQARNLKNGDPVELAALGVDKGKIQEETKELKQKLTNVISL